MTCFRYKAGEWVCGARAGGVIDTDVADLGAPPTGLDDHRVYFVIAELIIVSLVSITIIGALYCFETIQKKCREIIKKT